MFRNDKLEEINQTPYPATAQNEDGLITYWVVKTFIEKDGKRIFVGEELLHERPDNDKVMETIRGFNAKYAEIVQRCEIIKFCKE